MMFPGSQVPLPSLPSTHLSHVSARLGVAAWLSVSPFLPTTPPFLLDPLVCAVFPPVKLSLCWSRDSLGVSPVCLFLGELLVV